MNPPHVQHTIQGTDQPHKGCWRALLWQKLQAANVKNTDFVGTLSPDGCGFTYDGEHDGHGGYLATGIANANQLPGWLAVSQPDIVMMELGTNDVVRLNPPTPNQHENGPLTVWFPSGAISHPPPSSPPWTRS